MNNYTIYPFLIIIIFLIHINSQNNQSVWIKQNLIKNHDFKQHKCTSDYCVYSSVDIKHYLKSLTATNTIQIGILPIYSDFIKKQIIMLRYGKCIRQIVTRVPQKIVNFQINWAVKRRITVTNASISLIINNVQKATWTTIDYQQVNSTFNYSSFGGCQIIQVKICGWNVILSEVFLFTQVQQKSIIQTPDSILTGFSNPETTLNFMKSECVKKMYTVQNEDYYDLSLNYRAVNLGVNLKSYMSFYWNNQLIKYIIPSDQTPNRLIFQVYCTIESNTFLMCPSQCSNQRIFHQITFLNNNNMNLLQKPCRLQQYVNLIQNGDFSLTTCPVNQNNCQYRYSATNTIQNLKYWKTQNHFQILNGQFETLQLPKSFVLDTDGYENTCFSQQLQNLIIGTYKLQFDCIASSIKPLQSSYLTVTIGNLLPMIINPLSYKFLYLVYTFTLLQNFTLTNLTFCAFGASDTYGSKIDNVKMFKIIQNCV